ncbi:follicular epithelium yolk protein subunit [Nocardiopsis alba]|uniref:follicular epithelium yolk protein subunit n=1 Tax=Nocardiopsis alba TaxID=53437 RepID=UPI003625CAAA
MTWDFYFATPGVEVIMAGIRVSIDAGSDSSSSKIAVSGYDEHVITDKERGTYDIGDASLKRAIGANRGKQPNDAFVKSPTPWGDLYKTYGWREVHTYTSPSQAYVTGIQSEPVIVATKTLTNNSSIPAEFDAGISEQVTNTVSNTWSSTHSIEVSQEFNYDVKFLGAGGGGSTSFSYTHQWGQEKTEEKSTTVGTTSGVKVTLNPGQSVVAKLVATRGVLNYRIIYKATLNGGTAYNYNPTHEGHHFWWSPINNILNSGNLSTERSFTEDLQVGYYSDSKVELTDPKTGRLLGVLPAHTKYSTPLDMRDLKWADPKVPSEESNGNASEEDENSSEGESSQEEHHEEQ